MAKSSGAASLCLFLNYNKKIWQEILDWIRPSIQDLITSEPQESYEVDSDSEFT